MFNYDYLKKAGELEARKTLAVIEQAKVDRQTHRFHRRGFSNDKGKTMRRTAKIPTWVLGVPEYKKYFDPAIPYEDRNKEMRKFFNLDFIWTPWGEKISPRAFLTVDRQ